MSVNYKDYGFKNADEPHMYAHFMPHILALTGNIKPGTRVLDVGCGNGFLCGAFLRLDCNVVGINLGEQGIEFAPRNHPKGRFELLEADCNVEHLYAPRDWAYGCYHALKPEGHLICTTPYHGYMKNLLIALAGKWDDHANPLWDGCHIKLWSPRTLSALLKEAGFVEVDIRGAGRIPGFWMTMIAKAKRPK